MITQKIHESFQIAVREPIEVSATRKTSVKSAGVSLTREITVVSPRFQQLWKFPDSTEKLDCRFEASCWRCCVGSAIHAQEWSLNSSFAERNAESGAARWRPHSRAVDRAGNTRRKPHGGAGTTRHDTTLLHSASIPFDNINLPPPSALLTAATCPTLVSTLFLRILYPLVTTSLIKTADTINDRNGCTNSNFIKPLSYDFFHNCGE